MGLYKSRKDFLRMREAGRLNTLAMQAVENALQPGITALELDEIARNTIRNGGGEPCFLGYHGYPATICASVDDVVVHGIPDNTPLREGSIISIDVGTQLDGWCADMARTFTIGRVSDKALALIRATEDSFWAGFEKLRAGNRIGDVSHAVQISAESGGYGVVRALTGHGIGRKMHEAPSVPNFGRPGTGMQLRPGMTIALEPMITAGTWQVETMDDQWTVRTLDRSLAAHYQNTVFITEDGPVILTEL